MLTTLVTLATLCFTHRSCAQGTLTPLYLFTSGSGSITPFQDGQLLEVGQSYDMTAVPDPGYIFSSWQSVNVFVITQTNYDANGNPLPPVTSVVPSAGGPQYTSSPQLEFTMQSPSAVTSAGANPGITRSFGWEANFVPVPEPSDAALIACGIITITLLRRTEIIESVTKLPTRHWSHEFSLGMLKDSSP